MESLLPLLLGVLKSPEVAKLLPMILSAAGNVFPNVSEQKAPAVIATLYDTNGVKWTQTALHLLGYTPISVDGVYGKGTKEMVMKFQRAKGLEVDGWAGENTVNALREALLKN